MEIRPNRYEEELLRRGDRDTAFDSMLNRFNKHVADSGILKELKKKEFYEKPSIIRARKKRDALVKQRRRTAKEQSYKNKLKGGKHAVHR